VSDHLRCRRGAVGSFEEVSSWATKSLELDKPANGMPPAPTKFEVPSDVDRLTVCAE
jgi:hypothetical protein